MPTAAIGVGVLLGFVRPGIEYATGDSHVAVVAVTSVVGVTILALVLGGALLGSGQRGVSPSDVRQDSNEEEATRIAMAIPQTSTRSTAKTNMNRALRAARG